jgi:hypothetical protein
VQHGGAEDQDRQHQQLHLSGVSAAGSEWVTRA